MLSNAQEWGPSSPDVRLSPATAAGLRVLALRSDSGYVACPPPCVRHMGGAFTALTRLEDGLDVHDDPDAVALDLAAWGSGDYRLPALRDF